jgi:methionyl aminopeptidase
MVIIKSPEEIAIMRQCGRIWGTLMRKLERETSAGSKTEQLDVMVARELEELGAKASFKGYQGFPSHLCVSVNGEVVHGIPGGRILEEGDIVSLDLGVRYRGFHADGAITVGIGEVSSQAKELMAATEGSLQAGIAAARCGGHLGDISAAIQSYVESRGFSVIREYTGHGVGRALHEEPQVPNFSTGGRGIILQKGMTLAIEPMVSAGDWRTKLAPNQWTVLTADGSLSAHFEHSIAITESGPEILTHL